MNYYVKEINSSESKILDKIDIIKRYGVSVSKYEKKLQEILNKTEDDNITISDDGKALASMKKETINMDILNSLKKLEEELDSYEYYLKIYFRNSSLQNEIENNKDITEEKIELFVKTAKSLLKEIEDINIDNVKETKKIIKDIYYTVYKVIKLELIMNGESNLLKFIISKNNGTEYINDLVREEINKLKKDGLLDQEIIDLINKLSMKGINYTYASDKLILLLALKDKDLVLSKFDYQLNLYDERIKKIKDDKNTAKENKDTSVDKLSILETKRNRSRNKAIISSILLSLNLISYKVMPSILKSGNTETTYRITRELYDTISDEVRSEKEEYSSKKESEYTELIIYGAVNKHGIRTVTKYTFSDNTKEDIREYIDMIDNNTRYTNRNSINYRLDGQLSKEEYTVVERMTYGDKLEKFNEEEYKKDLQRALMIIYSLGGVFTTSMLTYLLIAIHNNKKYKEELHEFGYYDKMIDKYEYKAKKYENLKDELIELKKDYNNGNFNPDDYKKVLKK